MNVYIDARCLQDPTYAWRGVGLHTATVLADLRTHLRGASSVTAILDPRLPPIEPERLALFDRTSYAALGPRDGERALFLQPSPMTHDQDVLAPLLKLGRVYRAAIVYDFIPLEEPKRYLPDTVSRRAYETALVSLRGYDRYLSISAYSAEVGIRMAGLRRERVTVTGVAVREPFWVEAAPPPQTDRYFIVVGGDDPRKNVECAIRAHGALARDVPDVSLWVLGRYGERSIRRLRRLHAEAGGAHGRLRFLHGVSDSELASLYRGALANVCPSRAEGFSIPVVEAIAAACPSLVASSAAQRELMPLAEAQFGPDDPKALASLMSRVLGPDARRELLERQRPFAARFARSEVSARFWSSIAEGLAEIPRRPRRIREGRPRVAVCSPYPPARSGVADYTAQAIRALARYVDVDVLSTQDSFAEDPSVRRFRYLTALPFVREEYDRVVSVIGNSEHHLRIVELLTRYGGPCVSHDNRMSDFYRWWLGATEFNQLARRILGRRVGIGESEGWLSDPAGLPALFFDEILQRAEPFIVHSRPLQRELEQRYRRPIACLPFCYRSVDDAELVPDARRAARERLGIPQDQVVIVTLGIVDPTKAPLECVSAMRIVREWGLPAHLYFVGRGGAIAARVRRHAAAKGVADRVHVLESWTSEATYRDFLRAADVGIQLRTHGFGGLSGAALDCIAYGIPTVLNANLAEALDSPPYGAAIPDQIQDADIATGIRAALAARSDPQRLARERVAYAQGHGFDAYARGLLALLGLPADG